MFFEYSFCRFNEPNFLNLDHLTLTQNSDLLMHSDYLYFIQLDKEGKILFNNEKFQNQLTSLKSTSESNFISDYLYPNDFVNYQLMLKHALDTGKRNFIMEMRKIIPDGNDFQWIKWEFTLSEDQLGEIQVLALGHDIHKTNSKNLKFPDFVYDYQVKNEIMEGLFDDNLLGYWVWDLGEGLDQLSVSIKNMLGYDDFQEFQKGIRWQNHIHQDDKEKVELSLNDHFGSKGKIPFHCDFRIKSLIGIELWVIGYGKVICWDNEGKPLTMVGCFFDISEKKKSEFLLEKQSRFLKDLTFNQSHLMRSKLANMIGMLEIMDLSNCSKEINSYMSIINKEAKKLDEVLKESINSSSALENNFSPL